MTWPTHWSTDPPTHPNMGGGDLQIINLQTELNYLDWVNIFKIFSDLTWPNPSTHQTIHPPIGGEFSTDFKSSNRIKSSWFIQVLWNFYWFRGCPQGSGGWVDWGGGGYGYVGVSHACTHAHATMHAHACCKHDKHGCLHGGSHLQFLYMYTYLCVCVCACMQFLYMYTYLCVCAHGCTCVGTPPCPQTSPIHLPPPQSCREPKTPKFNKS